MLTVQFPLIQETVEERFHLPSTDNHHGPPLNTGVLKVLLTKTRQILLGLAAPAYPRMARKPTHPDTDIVTAPEGSGLEISVGNK